MGGRLLVVAAVAVGVLAGAVPAHAATEAATDDSFFVTVLLPLSLAIIMASLGLSLTPEDFKRIFRFPKGVSIGLVNLLVVSPLLAFGMAKLFGLEAALAVGLVLLGASPGGTTANLLTHLARGDTALSVTMTAISSIAAVVTVPLYLGLAINHFDASFANDPEMVGVASKVFLITVVPLSIGMFVRSRRTDWAIRVEPRAKRVALTMFIFVVGATIAQESQAITDHFGAIAGAALALNVAAMTISFNVARLARLSRPQATAIAMELGVHNGTVAITVGAGIATILASPAAVYSVFMFITAGLFARMMYQRNARAEAEGEPRQEAEARPPIDIEHEPAGASAASPPTGSGTAAFASAGAAPAARAPNLPVAPRVAGRPATGGLWGVLHMVSIGIAVVAAAIVALALVGVEIV